MLKKIQKFFSEVLSELKKVSWSTRQEVIDATWVVLASAFFLGCFIALCDLVLSKLLGFIIR